MWGVSRWTARFLLLVMLAPAFGPLAMACSAQPATMHCMRQSSSSPAHAALPAMPCHHAMAESKGPQPESSETSFQADDKCCQNHCCCGATTSEWAQPASNLLSFLSLLVEPAQTSRDSATQSTDIFGYFSARAPPRS
jgi:hypothetical protein